jgi:hypothetical protein
LLGLLLLLLLLPAGQYLLPSSVVVQITQKRSFWFCPVPAVVLEGVRSASMICSAVVCVASSFLPLAFAFDFLLLLH